jgi:hypothetical protein
MGKAKRERRARVAQGLEAPIRHDEEDSPQRVVTSPNPNIPAGSWYYPKGKYYITPSGERINMKKNPSSS